MKKLLVFVGAIFICAAHADTVNINWLTEDQIYAQTTCETGGNFSLPTPTPTKYGYHFVGWVAAADTTGSWSRSGTPTPTSPIYPTFRPFGNTVLRALGTDNNFVADSFDVATGKITRRIGVIVLDGTENWTRDGVSFTWNYSFDAAMISNVSDSQLSSHYIFEATVLAANLSNGEFYIWERGKLMRIDDDRYSTAEQFKQWLADQYNNGTPVTVYYVLATPVEENY